VQNCFIVLSGLPASGKSTLGRAIASALQIPMFDKDEILEALFAGLGVGNSEWRSKLSRSADEELCKQASKSKSAIITSWWRHPLSTSESGTPIEWLSSLPGELIELYCSCSPTTAASRFIARRRHPGHLDSQRSHTALLARFEQQATLGPLGIGRLVRVSTEETPRVAEILAKLSCPP
jgi:AAA domain